MSLLGPFALALLAGVVSFLSPCCLPLMPGYVAYVSTVASEPDGASVRTRVVGSAALFVAGFAAVFILLGTTAALLGSTLVANRQMLIRIAGVFVIVMGLVTLGFLRIPALYRERRLRLDRVRPGPLGALPLGMAFAVGWVPCIGPVLAGVLTAAATASTAWRGAALLLAYSLGLGIPFILLALGYTGNGRIFGWFRRHARGVEIVGGSVLILMGALMISGRWLGLFTPVLRIFSRLGWPPI